MPMDDQTVLQLFSEFITIDRMDHEGNAVILFFSHATDVPFNDVVLNMMSDTYADLRLYRSHTFDDETFMMAHLAFVRNVIKAIPFYLHAGLDDRHVLKEAIRLKIPETGRFMLRKYAKDQMMKETVRTYLESDMNTTLAAKKLWVHRNTLIQRLEKFRDVTGFDVRKFVDAHLIYMII